MDETVYAVTGAITNKTRSRRRATDSPIPPASIEIYIPNGIWDADDFTVYVKREQIASDREEDLTRRYIHNCLESAKSLEAEVTLLDNECQCEGRALICLCAKTEWVSITLRRNGKLLDKITKEHASEALCTARKLSKGPEVATGFASEGQFRSPDFFNPVHEVYKEIYDVLFPTPMAVQGLIVVAGSTGTGKSKVVRGIIDLYLRDRIKAYSSNKPVLRRPHLVTYEDPIETLAFSKKDDVTKKEVFCPELAATCGFDYTPRLKNFDVNNIASAFLDAKRQTPSLFYIGEVRDNKEWQEIMTFAGEGNLVVATTHANSVVETISKIFKALNIRTPADRGQIAGRFISLVHLRPYDLVIKRTPGRKDEEPVLNRRVALPALWRNTPQGVKGLVSDGLGSVLPYYLMAVTEDESSVGRRYFAERFAKNMKVHHPDDAWDEIIRKNKSLASLAEEALIKAAIGFDLEEI